MYFQRFGTPNEIADAAVFLCSLPASFITGVSYAWMEDKLTVFYNPVLKTDLFSLKDRVIVITGQMVCWDVNADAIAAMRNRLLDLFYDSVEQLADDLRVAHGVVAAGYAVDIGKGAASQVQLLNCYRAFWSDRRSDQ